LDLENFSTKHQAPSTKHQAPSTKQQILVNLMGMNALFTRQKVFWL